MNIQFQRLNFCLVICTALLVTAFETNTYAQPGSAPSSQVDQLQKQLATLQSQLARLKQEEKTQDPFATQRVKSITTPRPRRVPEPQQDDLLHIRLYDLSDLFTVSPDYPAVDPNEIGSVAVAQTTFQPATREIRGSTGGGFGGGGLGGFGGGGRGSGAGGVFSLPPAVAQPPRQEAASMNLAAAQVSMNQLVNAIKATVAPNKWGARSDHAKIQFLGNTLLITATKDMHVQIANLIDLFREHWGKRRTISIQTYWIRAGATEAANLLNAQTQTEIGAGVIETGRWKEFLSTAKTEKRLVYSATLTGHNNQTLHAISGRQQQLTLDASPFEASNYSEQLETGFKESTSIVGFKPIRFPIHNGPAIQVTPLATRGGNFVILDLHAKLNELVAPAKSEDPRIFVNLPGGDKAEVKLDHGEYVACRMSTTIRCPKEKIVLAGSMTYDTTSPSDQPNLYIFVKATVHTIDEDESDWGKTKTTE